MDTVCDMSGFFGKLSMLFCLESKYVSASSLDAFCSSRARENGCFNLPV